MVDTVRSLSALQALLADNTSGDISAQDLRDMLVSVFPTVVVKTADESVTSSTTLQDDNELVIPVRANTRYAGVVLIFLDSQNDADFKLALSTPTGTTGRFGILGTGLAVTTFEGDAYYQSSSSIASPLPAGGLAFSDTPGNADNLAFYPFGVTIGGTAGDLQVQWAQRLSKNVATTVYAGSFIVAFPSNS